MKKNLTTIEKHKLAVLPNLQKIVEVCIIKWATDVMLLNSNSYKNEEYRKITEVAQSVLNNSNQYLQSVCKIVAFIGTINYKIDDITNEITYEGLTEDKDVQFVVNSIMPAVCGVTFKNKL